MPRVAKNASWIGEIVFISGRLIMTPADHASAAMRMIVLPIKFSFEKSMPLLCRVTTSVPTKVIDRPTHIFLSFSWRKMKASSAVHIGIDDMINAESPAVVRSMPIANRI